MNRILLCFLLLFPFVARAQTKTWLGTPTVMWPAQSTNAIQITQSGTNTSVLLNANVAAAKMRFFSPAGTPSGTDTLLTRGINGDVIISGITISDIIAGFANIYNSDGQVVDLLRTVSGTGTNSIVFQDFSVIDLIADSVLSQANQIMELGAGTHLSIASDDIRLVDSNISSTNATNGQVWTLIDPLTGKGEWLDGGGSGGNTIYTGDGTMESDRTVLGDGHYLSVQNAHYVEFLSVDNDQINAGVGSAYLTGSTNAWMATGTNRVQVDRNAIKIVTPGIGAQTASVGQVLTLSNTNGTVEFTSGTGQNIGNSDLTISDPVRTLDGAGNDLHIQNSGTIQLAGNAIVSAYAPQINLEGSSFVSINQSGDVTNLFSFENPSLPGATNDYIMVWNSGGYVRKAPITIGDIITGGGPGGTNQNFANTDLTFTGDRTHDLNGNSLYIIRGDQVSISASTNFSTAAVPLINLSTSGNSATLQAPIHVSMYNQLTEQGFFVDAAGTWIATPNYVDDYSAQIGKFLGVDSGTYNEYQTIYFKGTATDSGGGAFVAATADIIPAYSDSTQHPEGTIAWIKPDVAPTGGDTLQVGDAVAPLPILDKNNNPITSTAWSGGEYIMFVRSGISTGSHWTCESCGGGTSPSPGGNVQTVATTADLITETHDVVITQGYFAVGDGGNAAYRYVASDVTATNTVTVFEGSAGRYFLMQSGSISAKQAGAIGDGSTDDHDALQNLFDNCPNLTARLEPLSYRVVGQLNPPDGVKIIARGATITIDTTAECGVAMSSNSTWDGGTIVDNYISGGGSGNEHCPVRFGDWYGVANHGVSNSILKNVTLDVSGSYPAASVFVTQASENITIDTINIPSSSTLDDGILVHWGFVSNTNAVNGTRHPHNIKIRNIRIGEMTSTGECAGVLVSAGYDVSVENVSIEQARTAIWALTGDWGFQYSGFTQEVMGSVSFRNVSCKYVHNFGVIAQSYDTFDTNKWTLNYLIDGCTLIGPNAGAGLCGLYFDNVRNLTVQNSVIAGHQYGTVFTNGCANISFLNNVFATNALGGLVLSDPNTSGVTARGNRFQNNAWGLSGTNAAAIIITAGSNHRILDNDIGNPVTEANQEVGLLCIPSAVNITITGNRVLNVKGGGVDEGYYLGNSADSGHLWVVANNTANATTLMAVPQALPYAVRGKYRDFSAASDPTVGAFTKGDAIYLTEATSTPFALKVTVSGSPGTHVTMF